MSIPTFDISFVPRITHVIILIVGSHCQTWKQSPNGNWTLLSTTRIAPLWPTDVYTVYPSRYIGTILAILSWTTTKQTYDTTMNKKNPNGPVGFKSSKTGSRFTRIIPSKHYARYLNSKESIPEYDSTGRRVKWPNISLCHVHWESFVHLWIRTT